MQGVELELEVQLEGSARLIRLSLATNPNSKSVFHLLKTNLELNYNSC